MTNKFDKLYYKIIDKINKIGIPKYLNNFKPKKTNFNKNNFVNKINNIIKNYHHHTHIIKITNNNNNYKNIKNTKFYIKKNIGVIKLYTFNYQNNIYNYDNYTKKYILDIQNFLNNKQLKGLILDFREHKGGNIHPLLEAFSSILNNTTLFAWSNRKIKFNEKLWINMKNNKLKWNQKFININKNNNINLPIAIIIGKKTYSAGEFVASSFIGNNNVKFFGNNTGGGLSVNQRYKIDNYYLFLTIKLQTSKNGEFKQFISPNVYTNNPINESKKWINKYINKNL